MSMSCHEVAAAGADQQDQQEQYGEEQEERQEAQEGLVEQARLEDGEIVIEAAPAQTLPRR